MSTVKLDLHNKAIPQKIQQARDALTTLGTPPPAVYTTVAADLKATTDALETGSNAYEAKQMEADQLLAERNQLEIAFNTSYSTYGSAVQKETKGDEAAILAAGLDVRKTPGTPVSNLDPVESFNVTTTNSPGMFDFAWDRAKGAGTFELRWRKQSTPAGQFDGTKTTSKTRMRVDGFESGTTYVFDLRAHGSGEAESAWSNPLTKVAG